MENIIDNQRRIEETLSNLLSAYAVKISEGTKALKLANMQKSGK